MSKRNQASLPQAKPSSATTESRTSWCAHCSANHPTQQTPDRFTACAVCGRVLDDRTSDTTAMDRTQCTIRDIAAAIGVVGAEPVIREAHGSFAVAVERESFPTERTRTRVAAVCLYIALHRNGVGTYLLITFADYLRVSVYVLAALFVALCRILNLESHSFIRRLVDPSLFIHRYTARLLGRNDAEASIAALRITANVKREYMRTGQVPIGSLVGTALYISLRARGYRCSKEEVMCIVANTGLGRPTIDEFVLMASETKWIPYSSQELEMVCEHKNHGQAHFAYGLCSECCDLLVDFSGLKRCSRPTAASQKARRRLIEQITSMCKRGRVRDGTEIEEEPLDIDDEEIGMYLNNDEERLYKTIIWEQMNSDYLDEQAAKKAAHAANRAKDRKQSRGKKSRNASTAANDDDASQGLASKKRLSSRINYDVLSALNGDEKRQRTDSDEGDNNAFDTESARNDDVEEVFADESVEVGYDDYVGDGNETYVDYDESFADGDDYGF